MSKDGRRRCVECADACDVAQAVPEVVIMHVGGKLRVEVLCCPGSCLQLLSSTMRRNVCDWCAYEPLTASVVGFNGALEPSLCGKGDMQWFLVVAGRTDQKVAFLKGQPETRWTHFQGAHTDMLHTLSRQTYIPYIQIYIYIYIYIYMW